jgi:hypothetical protein
VRIHFWLQNNEITIETKHFEVNIDADEGKELDIAIWHNKREALCQDLCFCIDEIKPKKKPRRKE